MIDSELLDNCTTTSERETALFFDAIGLECTSLNFKLKTSTGTDLGEIDGIFVDNKNEIIFIYDDSEHSNDVNKKISGWFNKWSDSKNQKALLEVLKLHQHYRKYILYIDKIKSTTKKADLEPITASIKENCIVIFKDDFNYFKGLSKEIKKWCKNDFYNFLQIKPKETTSRKKTVIQYYIDNVPAFVFSDKVENILEYSYVFRRNSEDTGYQRSLNKTRISKISKLIDSGKLKSFPNSVLINCIDKIETTPLKIEDCPAKIEITLPHDFSSCRIVDGQHRLMSFAKSKEEFQKKYSLPVVLFNGMNEEDEIRTFIDINDNQDSIDKNLTLSLKAKLKWANGSKENLQKIAYLTIKELTNQNSNFENRIFKGHSGESKKYNNENKITLLSFTNTLLKSKIIVKNGSLLQTDESDFVNPATTINNFYISLIQADGKHQKYYFSNRGISLILRFIGICYLNIKAEIITKDFSLLQKTFIEKIPKIVPKITSNYGAAGEKDSFDRIITEINKELEIIIETDLRKLK